MSRILLALLMTLLAGCAAPKADSTPTPSPTAKVTTSSPTFAPLRKADAQKVLRRMTFPASYRPERFCIEPDKDCQKLRGRWFSYLTAYTPERSGVDPAYDSAVVAVMRQPTPALAKAFLTELTHDYRTRTQRGAWTGRYRQRKLHFGRWDGFVTTMPHRHRKDGTSHYDVHVYLRHGPVVVQTSTWAARSSSKRMRLLAPQLAEQVTTRIDRITRR